MNPESLFRKAQALGDDIREMESIDTLAAYHKAIFDINKVERKKTVYSQLMRYAALLAIPLLMTSLVLGYLYFAGAEEEVKYAEITAGWFCGVAECWYDFTLSYGLQKR